VHLGGYGSDNGSSLYELVETVLAKTNIPRIRLGSVEPWDLPENFWALFSNPRLMPHLHLPIQSGADSVLRRMSRRCKTEEFSSLIEQARQAIPEFNITTDVIVGFPGETEEEWQETLAFVKQLKFGHIHIFAFSAREGTKAATLPMPIPRETKRIRSEQLHDLAAKHKRETFERYLGANFDVLFEGQNDDQQWRGYTPNFLRVAVSSNEDLENTIRNVRINAISDDGDHLIAELI